MQKPDSALICTLSADGSVKFGTAMGLLTHATRKLRGCVYFQGGSLISLSCNACWCKAINERKEQNFKWFALLHSDVAPEHFWLDTLIEEAEKHNADFMSALVPIKNNSGLTSTAIGRYADDWGIVRRLALREIHKQDFPETFALSDIHSDGCHLLCNTGCCVVRMQDRFENGQVYFDSPNRVTLSPSGWQAQTIPEDWFFSRAIARAGGKVMATRKVKVVHCGIHEFPNDMVWGMEKEEALP